MATQEPIYKIMSTDADNHTIVLKHIADGRIFNFPIPQVLLDNPQASDNEVILALNSLRPGDMPPEPVPIPDILLEKLQPAPDALCRQLEARIDQAADDARYAVVGSPVRVSEYQAAEEQARQFKDAGYPEDDIPPAVVSWAINGRSAKDAADDILREAGIWNDANMMLRKIRLEAKEAVRTQIAEGNLAAARATATAAVELINEAVGPAKEIAARPAGDSSLASDDTVSLSE